MVGLRWWNQVDEDGKSHWIFEARKVILRQVQPEWGQGHGKFPQVLLGSCSSDARPTPSPLLLVPRRVTGARVKSMTVAA